MSSKFIVPFKYQPKNQVALIGNEHTLGAIEVPQYGMLLPGEQVRIEEANLITVESRDKAVAVLAKSIFDRLPATETTLTATKIDLMIHELQDGYQRPAIPAKIKDNESAIDEYLAESLKEFELKILSHRELLAEFMDEILELSKHFAKEQLRRYEVYATVIVSERIPELKGITYPELCEALKSKELLDRLGLFGIWEHDGILYSEQDIAKRDAAGEPKVLVEKTEAELAK
ncbi:MAG: hypothetical protein ACRC62_13125 [Microcoleus sp.]